MRVVLYVDDDTDELLIFESACRLAGARFRLHAAEGSEEGQRYLFGRGRYADRLRFPLPALVLLDVKMAGADGFDLLARMRSDPALASIPAALFTSSVIPDDAERAFRHGAAGCIAKPVEMTRTIALVRVLDDALDHPDSLPARLRALSDLG